MAHIRRTRHIMMPSYRSCFSYSIPKYPHLITLAECSIQNYPAPFRTGELLFFKYNLAFKNLLLFSYAFLLYLKSHIIIKK
ncbi:leader peptide SpeFL [Pasteurella multocida]|nr:leader peptide SpeFL [Pasteurella multocida]EPE63713.1 hypothetical protein I141_12304 [Pasteurella multocida P1933]MCL7836656.1 leader peptide SpeFL [Pasteurella multocida]MCL7841392.1 leader peptide SpeFL [Pasteurella multocida]MDX3950543.1 leader peptide SpeFL [Pasteurella multocida]MDX3990735.1 leader peptide SpeFL [Pasteurella multocida]